MVEWEVIKIVIAIIGIALVSIIVMMVARNWYSIQTRIGKNLICEFLGSFKWIFGC